MKKLLFILIVAAVAGGIISPGVIFSKNVFKDNPKKTEESNVSNKKPAKNEPGWYGNWSLKARPVLNRFYGPMELGATRNEPHSNFIVVHNLLTFQRGNSTFLLPRTFLLPVTPTSHFLQLHPNMCYMYWNN